MYYAQRFLIERERERGVIPLVAYSIKMKNTRTCMDAIYLQFTYFLKPGSIIE